MRYKLSPKAGVIEIATVTWKSFCRCCEQMLVYFSISQWFSNIKKKSICCLSYDNYFLFSSQFPKNHFTLCNSGEATFKWLHYKQGRSVLLTCCKPDKHAYFLTYARWEVSAPFWLWVSFFSLYFHPALWGRFCASLAHGTLSCLWFSASPRAGLASLETEEDLKQMSSWILLARYLKVQSSQHSLPCPVGTGCPKDVPSSLGVFWSLGNRAQTLALQSKWRLGGGRVK